MTTIDGPGNIAGQARPIFTRPTGPDRGIPVSAFMIFDTGD